MRFEKWQALGNDYVIVERDELPFELTAARARAVCEAHTGVGADGVLLLSRSADDAYVAELQIFNPDGSQAELSGNGAREAALYLRTRGWTDRDEFSILTAAGAIRPVITGAYSARVDMGAALLVSKDFPSGSRDGTGALELGDGTRVRFQHVSLGNPQCAIRVESAADLASLDLGRLGPPIEAHASFPNRTNVSWYTELDAGPPARVRARIFERGVGETASSGTGASGAAVAYLLQSPEREALLANGAASVTVVLDGGELLVELDEGLNVHLSGWAQPVFAGSLSEAFVRALAELG
ncbi:MAG TPA: diaminopimelate epimerase [Solirubrobacteraceae bacterium]|nr:diaminopimelate epimerase [Solirubrobacteraceae bacterium]